MHNDAQKKIEMFMHHGNPTKHKTYAQAGACLKF